MADELDRVLRQTFKRPGAKARPGGRGLGSFDTGRDRNIQGRSPGMVGRDAVGPMGRALDEISTETCPPWMNQDCLEVLSRFLEETFRNFQVNARPPSHIEAPFKARIIDAFPANYYQIASTNFTTIPGCSFAADQRYRGEIWYLGQAAPSLAAYEDLAWRIVVNGVPYEPYEDIRFQIAEFVPPTKLPAPIHVAPKGLVELQVRSISGDPYYVLGRIAGWYYPIRSESGDEVKSTLVD